MPHGGPLGKGNSKAKQNYCQNAHKKKRKFVCFDSIILYVYDIVAL